MNVRAVTWTGGCEPDAADAFRKSRCVNGVAAANSARKTLTRTTENAIRTRSLRDTDWDVDFFFIDCVEGRNLLLLEARQRCRGISLLVRFDHVANTIVNANHDRM